ncbi:PLP-dependent aminotransferase family protein [Aestuariirhabdus sp. Z084]|uniref:MocR-like pyridoxine biosynthesis transcription factor PdxR n=1 Tax=Aestuariirhabdus haliotis TaxID=2918751 RepID=UPI00201B4500|nr:PLP-dependent aminotransferase family protein [Aestuariirhabdus haliotis]MCL6415303.1 PLP-dependent aminotransferase family protein [Aestuariirhabdus haliotis]MCL6419563.1 PLP-dependent aminotransferase family protein [Aestuariirhabdus haliotis]
MQPLAGIQVFEQDPTPRYRQLYRQLRDAILRGQLHPGERLPSSRALSQQLQLSRNTVKNALELLQAEGYIHSRHGAGTWVEQNLPDHPLQGAQQEFASTAKPAPTLSSLGQRLINHAPSSTLGWDRPLTPGRPALDAFPWQRWRRCCALAGKHHSTPVVGLPELQTHLCDYLRQSRGIRCEPEQVLVFSGSQQALQCAAALLLDPGQPVLVEDPGFTGISAMLDTVNARAMACPVDASGFQLPDSTEAAMAIITPSRNYPLGFTLSLERRLQLLDWAKTHNSWIIEDDYDSEFRFRGSPLMALQGLDNHDKVIYSGTFSRIMFPGIRLGYLVVPPPLVTPFSKARRHLDGGTSVTSQAALAEFMQRGYFASHLRRMRKLYRQRQQHLHQQMLPLSDRLQLLHEDGGMHSVYLCPNLSDKKLAKDAQNLGLGVRSLSPHYATKQGMNGLMIGFAGYDEATLDNAVDLLQKALMSP